MLALAVAARIHAADIPVAGEYEIKAAFLVNFTQFVEWPAAESAAPGSPIVIGVLGTDPFGPKLDAVARGRHVDGHPIVVRRVHGIVGDDCCHILFVGTGGAADLSGIVLVATARGMLTVGDTAGFATRGGAIEFFVEDERVRFAINLDAAAAAGLKVSSHLAQLATTPRPLLEVGQ